jgi:hypothetical protein
MVDTAEVLMTSINLIDQDFAIPRFLDLPAGALQQLSQEAVLLDMQRKWDKGLPVVVWNEGQPYNKYPDGRLEYIAL